MSDYRWADGENVALESLTVLSPQPAANFVRATQRNYATDGSIIDQGLHTIWVFELFDDESAYQAMLTTLGINSALTNRGTAYTRNEVGIYTRYNATVLRPNPGQDGGWLYPFVQRIEVLLKAMELAT